MLLKYWSHKRHWDIAWEGFIFGNLKVYTVKALILSADFKKKHRCIILWFYDLWLIYATCIALTLIANVGGVHECGDVHWRPIVFRLHLPFDKSRNVWMSFCLPKDIEKFKHFLPIASFPAPIHVHPHFSISVNAIHVAYLSQKLSTGASFQN